MSVAVGTTTITRKANDGKSAAQPNLVDGSLLNKSFNTYGYPYPPLTVKVQKGKTYTFSAEGLIDATTAATETQDDLCVFIYNAKWSWSRSFHIKTTTASTKSVTFTWNDDDTTLYISGYYWYYPNRTDGSSNHYYENDHDGNHPDGKVILNWVKVEEGSEATAWCLSENDKRGDAGDIPQPNMFGYDSDLHCVNEIHHVVHTNTGFAVYIDSSEASGYACIVRSANVIKADGTYSVSGYVTHSAGGNFRVGINDVYQSKSLSANTRTRFAFKFTNVTKHSGTSYFVDFLFGVSGQVVIDNLKIEDSSTINGTCTPFSELAKDSISQHDNMLNGTRTFKGWWSDEGSVKTDDSNKYNGHTAAYGDYLNNKDVQIATNQVTLKAKTWYTLSWYAKGGIDGLSLLAQIYISDYADYVCPCPCENDDVFFKDASSLPKNQHTLTTDFTLHTLTFYNKTAQDAYIYFILLANSTPNTVYIAQPKLEECEKATAWCASTEDLTGAILRNREKYDKANTYVWDDEWRDFCYEVVEGTNGDSAYYYVLNQRGSFGEGDNALPEEHGGDNTVWRGQQLVGMTATDILLTNNMYAKVLSAVEAQIDKLIVKKLQVINSDNTKTLISLNADGKGSAEFNSDIFTVDGGSESFFRLVKNFLSVGQISPVTAYVALDATTGHGNFNAVYNGKIKAQINASGSSGCLKLAGDGDRSVSSNDVGSLDYAQLSLMGGAVALGATAENYGTLKLGDGASNIEIENYYGNWSIKLGDQIVYADENGYLRVKARS